MWVLIPQGRQWRPSHQQDGKRQARAERTVSAVYTVVFTAPSTVYSSVYCLQYRVQSSDNADEVRVQEDDWSVFRVWKNISTQT